MAQDGLAGGSARRVSTARKPYRFVGSGLENLYLVGVECGAGEDGSESVEIPYLEELRKAVGAALAVKKTRLAPAEVRFLRKQLGLRAKRFAAMVGVGYEQYSRIEHGAAGITLTVERVVRLLYATLAELSLADRVRAAGMDWTGLVEGEERIVARWRERKGWVVL